MNYGNPPPPVQRLEAGAGTYRRKENYDYHKRNVGKF